MSIIKVNNLLASTSFVEVNVNGVKVRNSVVNPDYVDTENAANGTFSLAGGYNSAANGLYSFVYGENSNAEGESTIVLGSGLTGASNNTVYVNKLNVNSVPTGTIVNNLGIDVNGDIIIGSMSSSDMYVTGGTYSDGTAVFTNTTGGTFDVTGFTTGSTDTYVTGFTYNDANKLTLSQNYGQPDLIVYINQLSGLTITGPAYYQQNITTPTNPYEIANVGFVTAYTANFDANDTYVTGGTNNASTNNSNVATIGLKYNRDIVDGTYSLPYTNTYTTGTTLNGNTVTFYRNDGTPYTLNLSSLTPTGSTDTYVTGFTYNNANIITLSQNYGQPNKTVDISTLSSVTVNGDVTVTGTTTTGNLIVNNPSGTTAIIGQGGLVIGSGGSPLSSGIGDLTIHGSLVVYGTGTTINTNELYIEDPTITLNYNPSGSSTSTSVGSGIIIQDGSGIVSTNTTLQIGQLYLDTNINSNAEYTSATGNANRGLFTQLNDIIVRNTNNNAGAPNGKRLIAEDDILDGGTW